jgi:glycine/D-amino acid oxidase-like deaminating enzyme
VARVVVIGAGIVGAACGYFLSRDGHHVTVLDRGPIGGGTTSRGEGNILVSDKAPGPELDLARWSAALWHALGADPGSGLHADELELDAKGGLVVASGDQAMAGLTAFAQRQAASGVDCTPVGGDELSGYEPHLAPGLPGGVFYPGDQQVQPVRAAAALLRAAQAFGAQVQTGVEVTGVDTDATGAVRAVRAAEPAPRPIEAAPAGHAAGTASVRRRRGGDRAGAPGPGPEARDGALQIPAEVVINAAGTWGGEVSRRLGAPVPVLPRRGFILVTEPLPQVVRHKVYTADYVANVASGDAGLETSVVVEGTRGGTVLIGASRERVGFDASVRYDVVRLLAAQAVRLFPMLADVSLMRVYRGFRPYCPDHLPVIGPDPRVPGVWHACGHEGAGIGLAPATGALICDLLAGRAPRVPPEPFSPNRFATDQQQAGQQQGASA